MIGHQAEKQSLYLQTYAVAFIDILGQSRKLRELRDCEWWKFDNDTRTILSETYGSVTRFRDLYSRFMRSFQKTTNLERYFLASQPNDEEMAIWKASKGSSLEISFIADSIVAMVPVRVVNGIFPFSAILSLMGASSFAFLSSLAERRAIRGAVAIGPCIFNSETDEVYGSALSIAVDLEKKADWPRLLVDEEIFRIAGDFAHNQNTDTVSRMNTTFAQMCLDLIRKDQDECLILDYLGTGLKKIYDIPEFVINNASDFVASQVAEHIDNDKIVRKYLKVQEYFAGVSPTLDHPISNKTWVN
jgi:hypothetical protein